MRAVIEEHHLFHSMDLGLSAGIRNFRLYIMVGLPFEQEEDIDAIIDLAERLKDYMEERGSKGTLTLSVNPFIPKPFTPFQWEPMADRKVVEAAEAPKRDAAPPQARRRQYRVAEGSLYPGRALARRPPRRRGTCARA